MQAHIMYQKNFLDAVPLPLLFSLAPVSSCEACFFYTVKRRTAIRAFFLFKHEGTICKYANEFKFLIVMH